jgi:hypothetical protein
VVRKTGHLRLVESELPELGKVGELRRRRALTKWRGIARFGRKGACVMHDQWIDASPGIVYDGVASDVHPAGLRIDFGLAHRTAIGKHRVMHFVVGDDSKPVSKAEARRLLSQFEKIAITARCGKPAIGKGHLVCSRPENLRG